MEDLDYKEQFTRELLINYDLRRALQKMRNQARRAEDLLAMALHAHQHGYPNVVTDHVDRALGIVTDIGATMFP